MPPPETKSGPGGGAPEPRCIAVVANAVPGYPQTGQDGNRIGGPGGKWTWAAPAALSRQSAQECPVGASGRDWVPECARAAYRVSEGRKRRYSRHCPRPAIPALDPLKNNQRKSKGGGHGG